MTLDSIMPHHRNFAIKRTTDPELRRFRETDMASLQTLIHTTIHAAYDKIYPPLAIAYFIGHQSEEKILERRRTGEILVMEREGDIIATGSVVGSYISSVYVRPDFQHVGYGGKIMGRLEKTALKNGCGAVDLNVSLPSKGFYEALGYILLEDAALDLGKGERLFYWKARKTLFHSY
jgi:GNAT superfamily N-acetyltransferase